MIIPGDTDSAHTELVPATEEQEPILANLLELYAHDFSEFHKLELGANGRFGYNHLPLYWQEPNRYPFLVRVAGQLAGLVLVRGISQTDSCENVWDMAEFFILRGYRKRGIGTNAAHQVWRRFPGLWRVRVMEANRSAHPFWEHSIAVFAGESIPSVRVEKDGTAWHVFSFDSRRVQ